MEEYIVIWFYCINGNISSYFGMGLEEGMGIIDFDFAERTQSRLSNDDDGEYTIGLVVRE